MRSAKSLPALSVSPRRDIDPGAWAREIVGVLAGGVLGVFAAHFDQGWTLVGYSIIGLGLVLLSWIDLRAMWLPREITIATAAASAPFLVVAALVEDEPHRLRDALIGALIMLAVLLVVHLLSRGGLGDGDVRLAPLLGMALGWLDLGLVAVGLLFGFLAGSLAGIVLMLLGRAHRRTQLPFGPFLALGTIVAIVAGEPFLDAVVRR